MRFSLQRLFVLTATVSVALALALRNGVDVVATVLFGAFLIWLLRFEVGQVESWGPAISVIVVLVVLGVLSHLLILYVLSS